MDELELAHHFFNAVDRVAYEYHARRISQVQIAIGARYVFDTQRLQHAFRGVTQGTVAENARLVVSILPVRYHCRRCGHDFTTDGGDCSCPRCGHAHTEEIGGEELRLLKIDIEEAPTNPGFAKEAS